MERGEFRKQLGGSVQETVAALERNPGDRRAQWFAGFLLTLGADELPALVDARTAFDAWRARVGDAAMATALRDEGVFDFLLHTWTGLGQAHFDGPELALFVDWLVALSRTAAEVAELPYAVGNWSGSWRQVGAHAVTACERLARCALARDPANQAALLLYAQEDFLERVNRARPRGEKLTGPPVPRASVAERVAQVEAILRTYVDGMHPLEVASLDPIAVDASEVVDALIRGIDCIEWRGGLACIEALGRATVELPRVVTVLCDLIENAPEQVVDHVATAIHYGLKGKAVAALGPLMLRAGRILDELREDQPGDYRHQWPLRTVLTLAPLARGEERRSAHAFIGGLLATLDTLPGWKRERLLEFANEAPAVLRRLAPA
jgi:hypothetical protein